MGGTCISHAGCSERGHAPLAFDDARWLRQLWPLSPLTVSVFFHALAPATTREELQSLTLRTDDECVIPIHLTGAGSPPRPATVARRWGARRWHWRQVLAGDTGRVGPSPPQPRGESGSAGGRAPSRPCSRGATRTPPNFLAAPQKRPILKAVYYSRPGRSGTDTHRTNSYVIHMLS